MVQKHRPLARGDGIVRATAPGLVVSLALLLGGCPSPWTRPEPQGNGPVVPQPPEPAAPAAPPAPARRRRGHRARITSRPRPDRWSRRRTRCSLTATSTAHPRRSIARCASSRAIRCYGSSSAGCGSWMAMPIRPRYVRARRSRSRAVIPPRRAKRAVCSPMRCAPRDEIRKRCKSRAGRTCTE